MLNVTLDQTSNSSINSSNLGMSLLWYQFAGCAVAPHGHLFYFALKVVNLVLGTPCNVLVIWDIASNKADTSTSDIFIVNLAVLDAYFCLMTPIDLVNQLLLSNSQIWSFQRFAYGVKDTAPLFLVCICLDRYVAVVHPVLFSRIRDNKIRNGISVLAWILILVYGISKALLSSIILDRVSSGIILFAFAVMVFCNISIIWVLRCSVAGKEEMHPVKKKAFKMVLIILVIIVVNYLPPVALIPFSAYSSSVVYKCQIRIIVFGIMDLSCCMEPLLYIAKKERAGCMCCRWRFEKKLHEVKV
ncbi:proteinase-activated receptor 3-like [Thalassophryne amazonica]|uniref:proteinase-activated receptor 3-like n=1 Tax=Thalassophryne amazonica TaxID=390379 RepID=UPI0014720F12|nr:proteinase-activated receptor 3-like [Thalassophryne amazonica]